MLGDASGTASETYGIRHAHVTGGTKLQLVGHSMSDQNGVLLSMDSAVEALLQRCESELIGRSFAEITHPDDRTRNVEMIRRLGPDDGPIRIRKRYLIPDAAPICVDLQVSRLGRGIDAGRLVGTLYVPDTASILTTGDGIMPDRLWTVAANVDVMLQKRRAHLGDDLFGDHAWLILVQVYLAEAEGRLIDAEEIADRTRMDTPRVARWIAALTGKQLLDHPEETGRTIQLTAQGLSSIETLLGNYANF
ncbi:MULTISPECIES: PAS domain-containing protein [unclassified Sphingomonas]|uniref:PAS domain-containing protein n=1 Tax=Sphingomonas sp. PvP015 TaxID=3156388 RepID=UPI0033992498